MSEALPVESEYAPEDTALDEIVRRAGRWRTLEKIVLTVATETPLLCEAIVKDAADAKERRRKRIAAAARGKRLERRAKAWLESQGAHVETAPKVVRWLWDAKAGTRRPLSQRHDFFGIWDAIVVSRQGARYFVQVTTLTNVSHKRSKILASGFRATRRDQILAYLGRGVWRVFVGPGFEMPGEEQRERRINRRTT